MRDFIGEKPLTDKILPSEISHNGIFFYPLFVFPGEQQGSCQSHDTYIIAKRAADALQDTIAQKVQYIPSTAVYCIQGQ